MKLEIIHWRSPSRPVLDIELVKKSIESLEIKQIEKNEFELSDNILGYLIALLKNDFDIMITNDYIALDKKGRKFRQS